MATARASTARVPRQGSERGASIRHVQKLPGHSDLRARDLDEILEVEAPDGTSAAFAVKQKRRLDPRDVPRAVLQLEKAAGGRSMLFAVPYLGPRTRALLREAGASYADGTGYLRLVLERPALFIEAQRRARHDADLPASS